MKLFRLLFVFSALFAPGSLFSQDQSTAIEAVINRFFEGMEKGDTSLLLSACTENPVLQTIRLDQAGSLRVETEDFRDFVRFVGAPRENTFEERITFAAIQTEALLASAWTPYRFYRNGQLSHCGTNSFQLVRTAGGWKIQYIIDTRRKSCD